MSNPRNLSELIFDQVERRGDARFGMARSELTIRQALGLGLDAAGHLEAAGLKAGDRTALIGTTSNAWLVTWLAMVLTGVEAALVNPDYPSQLLAEMLTQLHPATVIWVGRPPDLSVAPQATHFDASTIDKGYLLRVIADNEFLSRDSSSRSPKGVVPRKSFVEKSYDQASSAQGSSLEGSPLPGSSVERSSAQGSSVAGSSFQRALGQESSVKGSSNEGLSLEVVRGQRPTEPPGLKRGRFDTAGYMHTSGTSGIPKFCEQSHEYFLRLGRFIADSMCLSESDVVLAPLPMFHINPLGYGVVGGITGGADVLGIQKFSARSFWPTVRACEATVLILHAPPVEILKRATAADAAAGHRVNRMFFADPDFLEKFSIGLGFSAYGSTEAGGLCHIWAWRRGDRPELAEGMSRYGGRARHDVGWQVDDNGEINVKAHHDGVLFNGYRQGSELVRPFDQNGWYHTGDLGRVDSLGNLVFIERRSESIRVKGEFVPISYVEQQFAEVKGVDDAAVWCRSNELVDDDLVLFVTGEVIPVDAIKTTSATLPNFMRPATVTRIATIPRDTGVGKVQRRLLGDVAVLETYDL